ncbi:hypothetical protein TWF694_002890 [Orbilia ellipsospora]|uniref:MARVEL domain-containing protein n=1 Tax=Orbilia ellipsospora TaxID=2528407 RepID=A0AAV9X0W4_9PEZI
MSTFGQGHTVTRQDDIAGPNPRESNQTISSRLTTSSCTARSSTPFTWPLGSRRRRPWQQNMMVSKTPRVLLYIARLVQVFCSILVLAAAIFSVVKFGIQQQEVLVLQDGSDYVDVDYNSLPDGRGDWRPVLLVALSSVSLFVFPLLTTFRRRRVSVVVEVVLLALWCSFMTLYIPTITTPFEPNCLHPKAPFEFLDDHTKETHAIGIDIGRNSTAAPTSSNNSDEDPIKINSDIHTYCIMSQVGVAAGLIVIIFTFLSILLLLLLSYQATDYLIERRALELLQHHALPSMVQQGIAPISNAYQTIANSIPPLRSNQQRPGDEENNNPHDHTHFMGPDDISPISNHNQEKAYSYAPSNYQSTTTGAQTTTTETSGAAGASVLSSSRSYQEQPERSNHDRIRPDPSRPLQLQGWVTQGYEVDR